MSQSILALCLSLFIGLFLNYSVFIYRFSGNSNDSQWVNIAAAFTEVIVVVLSTFFLLRILSLGGRLFFRIIASLILLISVAASYYMTQFNVTIGYGIIVSVMTTDIDLSKEVVGYKFILWMISVSILPLVIIWLSDLHDTLLEQLKTQGKRLKAVTILILCGLFIWAPLYLMGIWQKQNEADSTVDLASYGGVVAHSYLPANWLSSFGLFAYASYSELDDADLLNPAKKFTYLPPADIDQIYMIFIIGETARWDHMGILGYERDTTPLLAKEPNLVAFKGQSCDTTTKLSLRCMFVREGGTKDDPQRTVLEQNIFAVMKNLGFSSELFAMQSEVWFYNSADVDDFSIREMIAAEVRNKGRMVDDMLLVENVKDSLKRHPDGKHLIILHTKGSHYLYTKRYPRDFARFQPECMGVDTRCNKERLLNSFDNSILYTDYFIKNVIDQVRDKKALVFYASDHGESIGDNFHFHGTPRQIAPPEQFYVPLMVWASDSFLQEKNHQVAFKQLKIEQHKNETKRHKELFDSILGCLGYTSPDGGINSKNSWCG